MSTKTYDKKTAAFAGFLIQNIPADLDEETMDGWMQNPQALKRLLAGLVPAVESSAKVAKKTPFTMVVSTQVPAMAAKSTGGCLKGYIWKYTKPDFDAWLPKNQQERSEQLVTVIRPEKTCTFIEFAQAVVGVTTNDVKVLGDLLIQRGHTLTLTQAEHLAERTEAGETTGLRTDGCANFFFVETEKKDLLVAVGNVHRVGVGYWRAYAGMLGRNARWDVDHRFLLCNEHASKL